MMGTFTKSPINHSCNWKMSLRLNKLTTVPLSYVILLLLSLLLIPEPSSAHLNLSKQCGELTCDEHQYCRDYDHTCNPCSSICKEGSNNFSKDTCEAGCQDYLHDERYIRLQGSSTENGKDVGSLYQNLQKDVLVLKILVGVCLVVISMILAAFTAFLIYFWRRIYDSKGMTKGSESSSFDKNKSGSDKHQQQQQQQSNKKDGKKIDLPVIYDNKYHNSPEMPRVRRPHSQQPSRTNEQDGESPSKDSAVSTMNSLNSAKTHGGVTMSTLVNSGGSSSSSPSGSANTPNGINNNNRFRREPSESTIPECMAYDNASLSAHGQGPTITGQIYTHHV